ncbi:MAG: PAS domain-containing protein [Capsulimonas sp.]|uniref:PAS domain-containing protein n=1 Tax=Capsulimonas sp. TaxID=2494211 RepID=UPI0032637602
MYDTDESESHGSDEVEISRERLLLIANNNPLLIAYVGADGRYRFNNQTYKKWFGLQPPDLQGKRIQDVIGEAAYLTIRSHLEDTLAGNTVSYDILMDYAI